VSLSPLSAPAAVVGPLVGLEPLASAPIAAPIGGAAPGALAPSLGLAAAPLAAAPLSAPALTAAPSATPAAAAAAPGAVVPAPSAALPRLSAAAAEISQERGPGAAQPLSRLFDEAGPRFEQSLQGSITFQDVEFIRRNHAVGLHHAENLNLRPWTSVDDDVALGVDAKGRAFHVLKLKDRTLLRRDDGSLAHKDGNVGYLLSGGRAMRALFLTDSGQLFALDSAGRLLQYSPERWAQSAWPRIVRRTLACYGLTVLADFAAAVAASWLWSGSPTVDAATWAVAAFGAVGSLLGWGAYALNRWERQNERTDGFVAIGGKVGALRGFDRDGDDYRLNTTTGVHSLRALVAASAARPEWTADFGAQEKHGRLPRGIPPQHYAPEFPR